MILSIRVFDYDVLISSGLIETLYRRANDYESIRKYWKLSRDTANKVRYILGIYIRIVIDVKDNSLCSVADGSSYYFTREELESLMRGLGNAGNRLFDEDGNRL